MNIWLDLSSECLSQSANDCQDYIYAIHNVAWVSGMLYNVRKSPRLVTNTNNCISPTAFANVSLLMFVYGNRTTPVPIKFDV